MEIDFFEICKGVSTVLAAGGAVGALIVGIVKWFEKQNKQTEDIAAVKKLHMDDMNAIKDELCVLSYAMLAALDGLKQQGCNGNVTKAYDMLEKHLNQRAHDQ